MIRRGVFRPRNVSPNDKRSPMLRLLFDNSTGTVGDAVYVAYDAQWRTLWKAQRLGYLTDPEQRLTQAGADFIARETSKNLEVNREARQLSSDPVQPSLSWGTHDPTFISEGQHGT